MKRQKLRHRAAAGLVCLALVVAGTTAGNAQTWHWKYVTHTPNVPPVAAESTVALEAGELHMSYTVPVQHHEVIIESCRAALRDVANATTLHSQGRTFLLVALKPARPARCASGQRPAVALPSDDESFIAGIAAAINRSCCAPAVVAKAAPATTSTPTPKPAPTLAPTPAPTPTASAKPAPAAIDWVETVGSFAFVRVKNTSSVALRVRYVNVTSCRDVALGCDSQQRDFFVAPQNTITIATVTSADTGRPPVFHYTYVAAHGSDAVPHSGSSDSVAPSTVARMSAREVATSGAFTPARLLKRGSSRLAIGVTGTAIVRLVIAANGAPQAATIVSTTNPRLAAAAIETAVSSTFAPATHNGNPVAAKYVATFSFDGEDPALSAIPIWKRSPEPAPSSLPTASESDPGAPTSSAAPVTPQPATSAAPEPATSAAPRPAASAAPLPAASAEPQPVASPAVPLPQGSPPPPEPVPSAEPEPSAPVAPQPAASPSQTP